MINFFKVDKIPEEYDFLDIMVVDIFGRLKHVTLPKSYVSEKTFKEGIGFDASNFGFAKVTDSDMVAIPDLSKIFVEENEGMKIVHVLSDVISPSTGKFFAQYPRSIAKETLKYIKESGIADDAKMLVELEFHIFDGITFKTGETESYYFLENDEGLGYEDNQPKTYGSSYHLNEPYDIHFTLRNEIVKSLENAGIPVKYHHHEVGIAQHEIELNFMSLVDAADNVTLAKYIIRKIAERYGLYVTFMPKPMFNMAGNGMHVHQYLEKDGKSLFVGDELYNLSELALNYTAGILNHSLTGSLLSWSNPSTNSYKRLVPGFEAPISASFSKGSRSAAVRIPGYLSKADTRIEFRTGDGSANVYFFLSAMVLAGISGIEKKLDPVELGFHSKGENEKVFPLDLRLVMKGLKDDKDYLKTFPEELINKWYDTKMKEANLIYSIPVSKEFEMYFEL
ncbi:glutamine synthetase [Marinitoga sp. 1135]|uniref:Glutamine synthetase n=1 Tax=Marinitoga piezophila (strain DSM 14283 / JCM 11233 / KA3) TaxID=443254 RepID=H2J6B1_MARPK|nr:MULTISPECIES: glutamine synthetase beta-grasp domain-containing protein [Marinitoga]AEX86259.1 glutamine synthetase [Marinitoga piezophila KA3]APT76667.1 glutamine synthetase [Marinitoga sp. 1137]NUU96438.1 glutamine synthetase [Marinitoga sp. 1135]NUU98359.1 glutamine synthetase [Marinitoga sp. 1138]